MGKSGKKIKSDRINTLRKQYDAFLEDDKKRKDRNEYILGRLEDMKSSTSQVKIYHKENENVKGNCYSVRRISDYLNNPLKMEENLRNFQIQSKSNTPPICLTKQFESSILKEISKNYILIPKLQSCLSSGQTYLSSRTDVEDADWKSKYNILNELKKNEKESISDEVNNFILPENNNSTFSTEDSESIHQNEINDNKVLIDNLEHCNLNTPNHEIKPNNNDSKKIERNLTDRSKINSITHNNRDDNIPQIEIPNMPILHKLESNDNDKFVPTPDNNIHKMEVSQHFSESNAELSTNMEIYSMVEHDTHQEITNIDVPKTENQWEGNGDNQNYDNELAIQNKPEHLNKYIKEEIAYTEKMDSQHLSQSENESINFLEGFQENPKDFVQNDLELNNMQKHDSNEDAMNSDQNENAEINDLEKEQNEMFYTENSDNKYEYNEANENALVNPEENENYMNEQYPYYDESQQEQPPYAIEINEHEESSERYDPNYEQQYAENYETVPQYDNQQYEIDNSYDTQQEPLEATVNYEEVPQTNDNFEPVPTEHNISYQNQEATDYNFGNENYESQHYDTNEQQEYATTDLNNQDQCNANAIDQDYNQINIEQETVKEMEQALDTEDGYIDNQNTTLDQNTEEPIDTDVSSIKNESILKAP